MSRKAVIHPAGFRTVRLLLDCDPGKDDAVAIALAARHRERLGLEALCTVSGNVNVEKTTANAIRVLEHCGASDVPVFRGAARPLSVEPIYAEHVHGADGLGGASLPPPNASALEESAAERLARTDGETLAVVGPVTNLAEALALDPDAARRWDRVVVMGGGRERGNVTPHAEFNLYADPHAFDRLLRSGAEITLLTLDTTNAMKPTDDLLRRARDEGNAGGRLFAELWRENRFAVHDACVIGFLARPDLFEVERVPLSIDLGGETRGRTRFDPTGDGVEVDWISTIDRAGLFRWIEQSLTDLGV